MIPTAEELYFNQFGRTPTWDETFVIKEFTKLHVEAQRKAIKKELEEGLETFGISLTDDFKLEQTGNSLIDDAYPLKNIR